MFFVCLLAGSSKDTHDHTPLFCTDSHAYHSVYELVKGLRWCCLGDWTPARTWVSSFLKGPGPLTVLCDQDQRKIVNIQTEVKVVQNSAGGNTYPSRGDNTSAGAAPCWTRSPRSLCEGRSLHRASRNNCKPSCTGGKNAKPCSSAVRKKWRYSVGDTGNSWQWTESTREHETKYMHLACIQFPQASVNTCHPLYPQIRAIVHRSLVLHISD